MGSTVVTIDDLEALERRLSRPELANDVDRLKGWRRQLENDESFGRVFSGPQWLGGASIVDGTVEGNVFKSQVTIANLFQTAESPADRWELDPTGLRFYATVAAVPNTKIFDLNPSAGTLQFGSSGGNVITFSAGVLAVPAASITSLTIAAVGSGTLGGTYRSGSAGVYPRMDISTAGIVAYNSGGTETFNLAAASGNFTMIGTFQIASSAAASNRISMTENGIELYKSGTREFYLNSGATNGIDMLLTGGSVGQYIGMNPSTGFWLGASTYAGANFKVSPAGAATMTSATITSGTLTSPTITSASITSTTITGQTIRTAASGARVELDSSGIWQYNSGGTVVARIATDGSGYLGASTGQISWSSTTVSASADRLTTGTVGSGGSLNLGTLGVSGTITIGSGGKIIDGDGSYWDQNGITLVSSGTFGDTLRWQTAGTNRGAIYGDSTAFVMAADNVSYLGFGVSSVLSAKLEPAGDFSARGRIYPGRTSGSIQNTYYIEGGQTGAGIITNGIGIGGMLGISSGNTINFVSPTNGGSASNWSSFGTANIPDASAGYFVIQIGGVNYRVPFYANA